MTDPTLPIAHRVWAEPDGAATPKKRATGKRRVQMAEPTHVLFFDTETTTDHRQSLTFGSWRYCRVGSDGLHCVDEGLIYADDLADTDPAGMAILKRYVQDHSADTERERPLRLLSRSQFVDKVFFPAAYRGRARVVGFNLPFDLSRIAVKATEARGKNLGGLSLVLFEGKPGSQHLERKHRPRVVIKHLNSKAAFVSFSRPMDPDAENLIPEGSLTQEPDPTYTWRGRFLDLRTLAFALSGEPFSLDGACRAFGVEGKAESGGHGAITEQYVDYCRRDVGATMDLYGALMGEFALHPIALAPEQVFGA